MAETLVLVDYENVHKVDISILGGGYRAIVFIGANQNLPKAASKPASAHRFKRVDFQKVSGAGKNALDFHIAYELGRAFQAEPAACCVVLSKDKGFDPLISHLAASGFACRRVNALDELLPQSGPPEVAPNASPQATSCRHCGKAETIEHLGGLWCANCARFASPPDPSKLPSNQPGYRDAEASASRRGGFFNRSAPRTPLPEWVLWYQRKEMCGGIYDYGEWMCGYCVGSFAED
jgi:hypothetical protein